MTLILKRPFHQSVWVVLIGLMALAYKHVRHVTWHLCEFIGRQKKLKIRLVWEVIRTEIIEFSILLKSYIGSKILPRNVAKNSVSQKCVAMITGNVAAGASCYRREQNIITVYSRRGRDGLDWSPFSCLHGIRYWL